MTELPLSDDDLGVIARDLAAGQPQIVGLAPADPERVLRDRNDAAAERVGHFEAGVGHQGECIKDQTSRDASRGSDPEALATTNDPHQQQRHCSG